MINGSVKADYGCADEYRLTEAYLKQKAKLTSAALGQALVKVLAKLDAMMDLKPSGGVYYVPEHHLGAWRRLAEGVEQCQKGNVISTIRAAMDEGTARAVRDALTKQVQEEATKLVEDVSKGTLSGDGVRRRAEQAQTLIERVDLVQRDSRRRPDRTEERGGPGQADGDGLRDARHGRRIGRRVSVCERRPTTALARGPQGGLGLPFIPKENESWFVEARLI